MRSYFKKLLAIVLVSLAVHTAHAANYFQDNQTVDNVINPGRFQTQGDVEVIEFFWYGCHFCAAFEPQLQAWVNSLPKNVTFKRLPASWNSSMALQQRLYYTLEALNRLDLHPKIFNDISQKRIKLNTVVQIEQWASAQHINLMDWKRAFNSTMVTEQVNSAQNTYKRFELNWVPAIVINGKRVIAFTDNILHDANQEIQKELRIKQPKKPL